MEAARRVAGYTLGGADILRRAMGKKKPEEMAKQHRKTGARALSLLDSMWLGSSSFVAGRSEPSVADLLIYEEVAQLSPRFANLLDLAPGGHVGRVVVWTESAFRRLDALYGTYETQGEKVGYTLPRAAMANADVARSINSDEVQSRVRAAKPAVGVFTPCGLSRLATC